MMTIALTAIQSQTVCGILRKVLASSAVDRPFRAWVFGSRATGHARPFSDLDLLISWPPGLSWRERVDLADAFEASDLPFRVDIVESSRLNQAIAARVMAERQILIEITDKNDE